MEIVDLVFGGSKLFKDTNIFAGTPNSVNRHVELEFAAKKQGELGERQVASGESRLDGARSPLLDGLLDGLWDEGRVLGDVLQRLLDDPIERCIIVETEVASVDDVVGAGLFGKVVERSQVT